MDVGDASDSAGTFIGVDVGGTKISIAAMRDGVFSEPVLSPTQHGHQEALIAQLKEAIRQAIALAGEVDGVGLGIPSVIEFETGRVRSSVNVPLREVPLREVLQEELGATPVFVDNDATCAAIAEAHDEQGRLDTPNLVMLTVGTGVGGGIVIDGLPYRGATGAAAELGHTIVGLDLAYGARAEKAHPHAPGAAGEFPRRGSLESLASGQALDELARDTAAAHPNSALGRLAERGQLVSGADAVAAAHDGDEHAIATLTLLGARLGDRRRERDQHVRPRSGRDRRGRLLRGVAPARAGERERAGLPAAGRGHADADPPRPLGASGGSARRRPARKPRARARTLARAWQPGAQSTI